MPGSDTQPLSSEKGQPLRDLFSRDSSPQFELSIGVLDRIAPWAEKRVEDTEKERQNGDQRTRSAKLSSPWAMGFQ